MIVTILAIFSLFALLFLDFSAEKLYNGAECCIYPTTEPNNALVEECESPV